LRIKVTQDCCKQRPVTHWNHQPRSVAAGQDFHVLALDIDTDGEEGQMGLHVTRPRGVRESLPSSNDTVLEAAVSIPVIRDNPPRKPP
jgi:hypothetical protein